MKKSLWFNSEIHYKNAIQYLLNYYLDYWILPQYTDYIKKKFFKTIKWVHPFIKRLSELEYLQLVKWKYIPWIKLRVHIIQNTWKYISGPYWDILKSIYSDNQELSHKTIV